jgi:hypothetical protein
MQHEMLSAWNGIAHSAPMRCFGAARAQRSDLYNFILEAGSLRRN